MLLINGTVVTMDPSNPKAEAVAVKNGKIIKVGRNHEVLALKNKDTRIIDLKGRLLLPGFNDSHMHLLGYSFFINSIGLMGTKSVEDMIHKVKNEIELKQIEKGNWVRGRGWNHDYFQEEKRFPNKYDLDKISTKHPIILTRACGHIAIVNSKALEIANINKDTKQIEGGKFDIDGNGEPLGIFRENAIELINRFIPEPTVEEIKKVLIKGMENANACGITSVQTDDFGLLGAKSYEKIIKAYEELRDEGNMSLRVYEQCLIHDKEVLEGFLHKGYKTGYGDELFKIGPLKLLADGSLGARTAALTVPYNDAKETMGLPVFTQEEMDSIIEKAHNNGMQIAIHGIGDRTMYMAFEAIEKALKEKPRKDHRHGIVHCQITDEILLDKFKELNMIAYIQPIFLDYDWKIVESRVGEDLAKTSYNWKTFVEKGVPIACGSDCPVENFNVLHGIYESVTRKDLEGQPRGGWMPEQRLTVEEAVYGFTMGGAYASFEEDIKGSIEEGKLADMVVLSRNIFEIPEEEIKDVEVEMTIFNGEIVNTGTWHQP